MQLVRLRKTTRQDYLTLQNDPASGKPTAEAQRPTVRKFLQREAKSLENLMEKYPPPMTVQALTKP